MSASSGAGIHIFSTCPQSADHTAAEYPARVRDAARWSEAAGCTGMLVYTDNRLVDPWLVAQLVLQSTERLAPLIALQPAYMHPYSAAKMIASFAYLHGRRVFLNLVAGGFKNDLEALGDHTPHDRRYERLIEYMSIIQGLLRSASDAGAALNFAGEFYRTERLKLTPAVPPELRPGVLLSGSSDAGLAAARALGAVAVQYPRHPGAYDAPLPPGLAYGVRLGIIARADGDDAWRIARERFPEDRRGQLAHQLAMKVSDSAWHKQLSELGAGAPADSPYWLHPFENYKTFCPYLVGSYARVGAELQRYIGLGYTTFILDIPTAEAEFEHTARSFDWATRAPIA